MRSAASGEPHGRRSPSGSGAVRLGVALALFACGFGAVGGTPASAFEIVRGPYLQRISDREAVVRWQTDVPTRSVLWWGAVPGFLNHADVSLAFTTEHRRTATGLHALQLVYYAVGDDFGPIVGNDEAHRFVTSRSPGDGGPVRIWAVGDSGAANADAAAVRDGFLAFAGGAAPDAWLMLGDNAYLTGTDAEYQAAVFDTYPALLARASLWPAIGNHDALSSDSATQSGPFFDDFSLPRAGEAGGAASGTEAYYSFDRGQVHVVVLDTADSSFAPGGPMLQWLETDLTRRSRPWTVVAFHHPPYTKGSHDSDDPADSEGRMALVRTNVLPVLEAHGVDLVLSGHSHGYERSYLLDGHYGDSTTFDPSMRLDAGDGDPAGDGAYRKALGPHGGTVYVVAGSGSKVDGTIEPHPAIAVGIEALGSLVLDFSANVLDASFVRADGTVGDRFRVVDGDLVFADSFESGSTARWTP